MGNSHPEGVAGYERPAPSGHTRAAGPDRPGRHSHHAVGAGSVSAEIEKIRPDSLPRPRPKNGGSGQIDPKDLQIQEVTTWKPQCHDLDDRGVSRGWVELVTRPAPVCNEGPPCGIHWQAAANAKRSRP